MPARGARRRGTDLRIRALVLAAGLGQRLRPLTGFVPKPLLPVAGRPVIVHTLERLAALGCEAVAVNLHHLGDQVEEALGDSYGGFEIFYSREPELLGTLGAFGPLRDFFRPADLVVLVNGDSLCRWPLGSLVQRQQRGDGVATLLVSRQADPLSFGGGVGVDRSGRIVDFRPGRARSRGERPPVEGIERRVFAGAHVFSPRLLDEVDLDGGRCDIVTALYEPLLDRGAALHAVSTRARWHDLGTPRRYLVGALDGARGDGPGRLFRRRFLGRDVALERGAGVKRSAVEEGARIESGALVEDSVVLAGARIGSGSRIHATIVAPGVTLPPESLIEARMVTPLRAGRDPGASDSVVGRLVYTPLDRVLPAVD